MILKYLKDRKLLVNFTVEMILRHKIIVLIVMTALTVAAVIAIPFVEIHYDLASYLPEKTPTTKALKIIKENFDEELPNTNLFVKDITIPEAVELKKKIKEIDGVQVVVWLDDSYDVRQPLSFADKENLELFYKDNSAFYLITIDRKRTVEIIEEMQEVAGKTAIITGEAKNQAIIQSLSTGEVSKIMYFVLPLVLIILLITTSSYFEPFLFLIAIGIAILLNEGTNIFIDDVSYVTRSASATLQLAVSMDYAVFLLHSFARFLKVDKDVNKAMKSAMIESIPAISASASTTVFGFLALSLMQFGLGANLGIVLAKGIVFSFLSCIILLPILTILSMKLIIITYHKPFLPSFRKFSKFVLKICIPLAIAMLFIIFPSFLGQQKTEFIYGSSGIHSPDSIPQLEINEVNKTFPVKQQSVLLIPAGDTKKEAELSHELEKMELVSNVMSYDKMVGRKVPKEFLEEDDLKVFESKGYHRIIFYLNTKAEGDVAFKAVEDIEKLLKKYYEKDAYVLGQSAINLDLKKTIIADTPIVQGGSVLAIFIILIITFRRLSIPLILLFTIESAIWINLGIPYFLSQNLNYIGYQIISAVQLGATVDYGILFATQFLDNKKGMDKKWALKMTLTNASPSILSPASILAIAAGILGIVSSNGIISQLGIMLGRGALISCFMVLFFLPALLILYEFLAEKIYGIIKIKRKQ